MSPGEAVWKSFALKSKLSPGEVVRKRGSVVVEEKGVVGERTHGNANLTSKHGANRGFDVPGNGQQSINVTSSGIRRFVFSPDRCSKGTVGRALF